MNGFFRACLLAAGLLLVLYIAVTSLQAPARQASYVAKPVNTSRPTLPVDTIHLPPGFAIQVWAAGLPDARSLALGARGTVFVGTRTRGTVYAVVDNGGRREVIPIANGLNSPNGVAFRDGALYVAEVTRVLRFDDIENRIHDPPDPVVVYDGLPVYGFHDHSWKFIAFGPDNRLYISLGAPCNVCDPGPEYGQIRRVRPDGSGAEVYVRGIRNSVGFDWHPETGELWFTDNGRDWLGDDLPSDELNHVTARGQHFGYPYCHQGDLPDPVFGKQGSCDAYVPPAVKLGAHRGALGMRFYKGAMFPPSWNNRIIIAEHGSWNRSSRVGYRLVWVDVSGDAPRTAVFADGWLQDGNAWGRPVDVQVMPDGSLLVSDDQAGVLYRITYTAVQR